MFRHIRIASLTLLACLVFANSVFAQGFPGIRCETAPAYVPEWKGRNIIWDINEGVCLHDTTTHKTELISETGHNPAVSSLGDVAIVDGNGVIEITYANGEVIAYKGEAPTFCGRDLLFVDSRNRIRLLKQGQTKTEVLLDGHDFQVVGHPTCTPDKKLIYFDADGSTFKLNNGKAELVAEESLSPTLSQDGKYLVLVGSPTQEQHGIFLMEVATETFHYLAPGNDPALSDDASQLVFKRESDDKLRIGEIVISGNEIDFRNERLLLDLNPFNN